MSNYELAHLIVDNIMNKVNSKGQVFYMEYVRGVETLLNKYAAQQSAHSDRDAAFDKLRESSSPLSNLLAVIHGDGGHHEAEVGTEQAVADAIEKWYKTRR